jgi:hypothetical protein
MKRYVQEMNAEDREKWRKWQAWWTCFYAVVIVALIGIGFLVPKSSDTEFAQSTPTVQQRVVERPAMPAQLGLK